MAHHASREVVYLGMNAAPTARDAGVVGGVEVADPLQRDGLRGPVFELQIVGSEQLFFEAAGKVRAASEAGHHLGRRAAKCTVPRDISRERWRDERLHLIGQ